MSHLLKGIEHLKFLWWDNKVIVYLEYSEQYNL